MTAKSRKSKDARLVPCFPLHALLVALNQSAVDYVSLDVEGFELEVRTTSITHAVHYKTTTYSAGQWRLFISAAMSVSTDSYFGPNDRSQIPIKIHSLKCYVVSVTC